MLEQINISFSFLSSLVPTFGRDLLFVLFLLQADIIITNVRDERSSLSAVDVVIVNII